MDDACMVILFIAIFISWTYYITSLTLTAMALDRLTSLITPYRYLSIVTSKRCLGLCIILWIVSLLISLSFVYENYWKFLACSSASYKNGTILLGMCTSNFVVIGVCNLTILLVNLVAYISIIVVVWHKRQTLTHGQQSVMKKLFTITLSYIVFHGPFCILIIVKGPGNVDGGKLETLVNASGILVTLSIFVDPILYVWRYKTCRYQLMMMMTPFCDGKREKIRQKHNQIYCNYDINYVSRESIQNQGD
ncbi:hypothetical protein FSP39_003565 [Pinctada imbricata]|uniref:G-protein coupled receptors family 1 profile domain-containing protein n=1 Tax=Pinctada imbricata TaxID=66713 RepID=A0AA88YWV1_PINIB|nr:hypothetical protein FSP39_003565 [Pinctada imbricata]